MLLGKGVVSADIDIVRRGNRGTLSGTEDSVSYNDIHDTESPCIVGLVSSHSNYMHQASTQTSLILAAWDQKPITYRKCLVEKHTF